MQKAPIGNFSPPLKIVIFYEAVDAVSCAATYAYHLTQAHAFIDGNKRLGAAIAEVFLKTNGFELEMSDKEVVDLFLAIASSQLNRDEVEQKLRDRVRPKAELEDPQGID